MRSALVLLLAALVLLAPTAQAVVDRELPFEKEETEEPPPEEAVVEPEDDTAGTWIVIGVLLGASVVGLAAMRALAKRRPPR